MVNRHIIQQLEGVRQGLIGAHASSRYSAAAAKGAARAEIVSRYLSAALPFPFRAGMNAQITDREGLRTGEIDVVLENGFAPSFPIQGGEASRLYLAEGVGAVIEVKSNLQSQWREALAKAQEVKALTRKFSGGSFQRSGGGLIIDLGGVAVGGVKAEVSPIHENLRNRIPMFVIGYEGWGSRETLSSKLTEAEGAIDGILQIDTGFFVSSNLFRGVRAQGATGLYCLLTCINEGFSYINNANFDWLSYVTN